jgi:hypothetical protein
VSAANKRANNLPASATAELETVTMTFDSALTHAVDYGKFIVQLWNYYIVLVIAMIGWLVTLRSKALNLDLRGRAVLIASYCVISAVFFFVLEPNQDALLRLMRLMHELAQVDTSSKILSGIFAPEVDNRFITTLNLTSRLVLPVVTILVSLFMWFITDPVPQTSASGPGKTES